MSEKGWSIKYHDHSFRGKRGKKGGSQFPRHAMNVYEGTHLGMKKKIWSKSGRCDSGWHYGGAGIQGKYIIGLLNKFVGKPYEDFKQIYDNKLKQFKKYDLTWSKLSDYLHDEPKDCYWRQEFYIDDNGLIQRCKLRKRHFYRNPLNKHQIRFNERVKVPNLGVCRNDPKYQVKKSYWGRYESDSYLYFGHFHTKMGPILLGKFYVAIDKKVFKLPVYTCLSKYLVDYAEYSPSRYDYNLHKYVNIPYEQYKSPSEERDVKLYKKRLQVTKDWIPVCIYPSDKLMGQDCWVLLHNHKIDELKASIANYERLIQKEQFGTSVEVYKKEILKAQEELEKIPEKQYYNMGYGKFYLFVRRSDFEREVENMV